MTTSVVVIVADRAAHLAPLADGLLRGTSRPDELVVVDMGSADEPRRTLDRLASEIPVAWVELAPSDDGRLPLAAARNAGADRATGDDLIFLDVDCIPARDLVGAYRQAIGRGGIVCGPVRHLERFWGASLDTAAADVDLDLWARSAPNPARPSVAVESVDDHHELFWSLAFGVDRRTWDHLGGFDEAYVGYGAEDTDLAFTARALGIHLRWIPDGTAFHQWHPVSDPPVEHLLDVVDNARRFRSRWGRWPMEGWLAEFHRRGLVEWDPSSTMLDVATDAPALEAPRHVVSIPASHPYTRRVLPDSVAVPDDPTDPWWPHAALDPEWISARPTVDLVHLHFGYEHLSPAQLERWCQVLDDLAVGLVVTVHDLHNPHTVDNRRHERHLTTLLERADEVMTLTAGAAAEIERRWDRRATVVPHPHVAPLDWCDRFRPRCVEATSPRVAVNYSSFRPNVLPPEPLLLGLAAGVAEAGAVLSVRADSGSSSADLRRLRSAATRAGAELTVVPRCGDGALVRRCAALDVAVLPYAFGTHSGMVELCHDVGTHVVVADTGHYREQWPDIETFVLDADGRPEPDQVSAAILAALTRGPAEPAARSWRESQLKEVRAAHAAIYARVAERCRS